MAVNTAARINRYLRSHKSPLAGLGAQFVQAGERYGIDPLLLVAISGAESSFATTRLSGAHNPFGWGPGHNFGSFSEAINTIARGLRKGYFDEGLKTIAQIGGKWAPIGASNDPTGLNNNWVRNVTKFYGDLGGSGVTSGTSALTKPNVPSRAAFTAPDLSSVALQNLSDLSAGRYDPVASLSNLATAVATAPAPEPAFTPRTPSNPRPAPNAPMKGTLAELFYDPLGGVKNGRDIPSIGGHGDHLHIAATRPAAIRAAIAQAKRMGLTVTEHPSVGTVHKVHVPNSYHYRGLAADISGDPKQLRWFYWWASRTFR